MICFPRVRICFDRGFRGKSLIEVKKREKMKGARATKQWVGLALGCPGVNPQHPIQSLSPVGIIPEHRVKSNP